MAGLLVLLSFALVTLVGVGADDGANVQIVVPDTLIEAQIQRLLPTFEKTIHSTALPTCCYDDVGEKHVHLDLVGSKINSSSISLKMSPSAAGVSISGTVSIQVLGSYRLCLHDDPFSKHGCSTLYGCKGNFYVEPKMAFSMGLEVHGGAVTVAQPSLKVESLANNLCSKIGHEISSNIPKIETEGAKAMAGLGPKISAAIKKFLRNQSLSMEGVNATVALAEGTTFVNGSLVMRGIASLTDARTGHVLPWQHRSPLPMPLPSAMTLAGSVSVYVDDSVLSNAAYPFYESGKLVHTMNVTVDGAEYKAVLQVTGKGPEVLLNTTMQHISLPVLIKATSDKTTVQTTVNIAVGFNMSLKVDNSSSNGTKIAVHVSLSKYLDVSGVSTNCTGVCQDLLKEVVTQAQSLIVLADIYLNLKPLSFELPPGLPTLSSLTLIFGSGYVQVSAKLAPADEIDHIAFNRLDGPGVSKLACPAIPKARPDGCI